MPKIDQLFKVVAAQGASDLHLRAGSAPYLRLNGEMTKLNYRDLTAEEVQALIFEILTEKQKQQFIETWELDCSYALEGTGRFRCNVFMQRRGLGAVFRLIPDRIKTAEELGLPMGILKLIEAHKGLILVTGPTGSGKSTTLASMINEINVKRAAHIITIEDPIEFVHESQKSLVNQREVGGHTKSFANALRASLREDPDIILVGEMRDLETVSLALTAAETGHLVFGTLHTSGAAKTIYRIIDVFPPEQQSQVRAMLAESLRGVVSQSLLPRADGRGRVAVIEMMINNPAIANLIREGKTYQIPSIMQTSGNSGMILYDHSIEDLHRRGLISDAQAEQFLSKFKRKPTGGAGNVTTLNTQAKAAEKAPEAEKSGGLKLPLFQKK